jgi:hypothetical protein
MSGKAETDVAKLGDSRRCGACGGVTVLRIVQPSMATLGWVDDGSIPYDVQSMPMWQCEDCDDLQPLDTDLEE